MPLFLDVHSLDDPVTLRRRWHQAAATCTYSAALCYEPHRALHAPSATELPSPKVGTDMSIDHETSPAEHAEFAPPEAWDAIAAGYAEHVAPGEQ